VSAAMEDLTPLDFLKAVYLNEALPLHARLKAATEAAKYMHPRLAVSTQVSMEDFAVVLEEALRRTQKVINSRPVQVLEPPKAPETSQVGQVTPEDMSKPFAHDTKSRYRRL
jgi:hypothetical protein